MKYSEFLPNPDLTNEIATIVAGELPADFETAKYIAFISSDSPDYGTREPLGMSSFLTIYCGGISTPLTPPWKAADLMLKMLKKQIADDQAPWVRCDMDIRSRGETMSYTMDFYYPDTVDPDWIEKEIYS